MEQKREQFNQLVEKFYERNKVDDKTNEEYLENFRLRVGKFLSQKPLEKDSKVKEIIFNCLKDDYKYYSKSQIAVVLKSFHTKLNNELIKRNQSIDDCYFIDVLNKDTMKNNSSNELITQYLRVNKLSDDLYKHFFRMVDIERKKEHDKDEEDYRKLLKNKKYLIMIDDYSSTGRTIQHFIEIINKYTPRNIKLIFLCLHMTEKAKKTLTDFCSQEGIDCQIYANEISQSEGNARNYSEREIISFFTRFHTEFKDNLIEKGYSIRDCLFTKVLNTDTIEDSNLDELLIQYIHENRIPNNLCEHFYSMVNIEPSKTLGERKISRSENIGDTNNKYYTTDIYEYEKKNEISVKSELLKDKKYLIMMDDYSGTGSTIKDFIEIINKYIPSHIKMIVFCLHITEKAKKMLEDFFSQEGIDCHIIPHEISKPYFHNNEKNKEMVQIFEKEVVKPRRDKDVLGFRETQSVLTTYRNTPNNTLSLFWSENGKGDGWRPIFLRKDKKGILDVSHDILELGRKIKWYFRYKEIPKEIEEQLILLIYLRDRPKEKKKKKREKRSITKIEVEISHIICYTDRVIEECEKQGLISIINSCFELSDSGLEKLREYSLDNENIIEKIEKEFEKRGKQKEAK